MLWTLISSLILVASCVDSHVVGSGIEIAGNGHSMVKNKLQDDEVSINKKKDTNLYHVKDEEIEESRFQIAIISQQNMMLGFRLNDRVV